MQNVNYYCSRRVDARQPIGISCRSTGANGVLAYYYEQLNSNSYLVISKIGQ